MSAPNFTDWWYTNFSANSRTSGTLRNALRLRTDPAVILRPEMTQITSQMDLSRNTPAANDELARIITIARVLSRVKTHVSASLAQMIVKAQDASGRLPATRVHRLHNALTPQQFADDVEGMLPFLEASVNVQDVADQIWSRHLPETRTNFAYAMLRAAAKAS